MSKPKLKRSSQGLREPSKTVPLPGVDILLERIEVMDKDELKNALDMEQTYYDSRSGRNWVTNILTNAIADMSNGVDPNRTMQWILRYCNEWVDSRKKTERRIRIMTKKLESM